MSLWKNLVRSLRKAPDKVVIGEVRFGDAQAFQPVENDPFIFGLDFPIDLEQFENEERLHQERVSRVQMKFDSGEYAVREKNFPGRGSREIKFDPTIEQRRPLAPRSALFIPRPLTSAEAQAVALMNVLDGLTPKGTLKKKLADARKGQRRVVFSATGRMKEVKGA